MNVNDISMIGETLGPEKEKSNLYQCLLELMHASWSKDKTVKTCSVIIDQIRR